MKVWVPALRCIEKDAAPRPGHDVIVPSLRWLRVILDRRAGANQIAVAIDIVDPSDRRPVFVRARSAGGEAALGAAIGARPRVVGNVVHGVRRMSKRRGLDLP